MFSDSRSPCDKVELVTREAWKAEAPKSTSAISSAVDYVFIHHTAEKKCYSVKWCTQVVQDIQKYHMTDPERSKFQGSKDVTKDSTINLQTQQRDFF